MLTCGTAHVKLTRLTKLILTLSKLLFPNSTGAQLRLLPSLRNIPKNKKTNKRNSFISPAIFHTVKTNPVGTELNIKTGKQTTYFQTTGQRPLWDKCMRPYLWPWPGYPAKVMKSLRHSFRNTDRMDWVIKAEEWVLPGLPHYWSPLQLWFRDRWNTVVCL